MISAKDLSKTYGELCVLKGVDISINKGEIVAIIGPSGAGKTTLLQLLGTLISPDKNLTTSLRIQSTDVLDLNPKQLANFRNQSLGFIFQFHELLDEFSGLENVMMPAMIQGKSGKKVKQRALELLTLLGVDHRVDHKTNSLSGGEQQRIAVARALMNSPAIIFADEPSGNLDSHNAEKLHELFFKLRDELGQTFVIVTHNKELAKMADRTIELVDGEIVA
ncbi:ABC transporter ATP-binding protein [Flavobacteriaceae bacterium]|nr:ABC transporter ATP-binding protein [Flavobacteriaceae bacterium]